MTDLIARIESADGPDRELDCRIWCAIDVICRDFDLFSKVVPYFDQWQAPRYTASIDAALTLVPEDAFWRIGHDGEGADPSLFKAQVLMPMVGQCVSIAATPALALAAAALKERGV